MIRPSAAGRHPILIISAVLLLAATTASAFNITILLGRFPGFEQFNSLLSATHLAEQINSRTTITVLGLPNDRLSAVMQMTPEVQKSILSLHVILDYYDMIKINKLPPGNKTTVTTLYQSSGVAGDQQGFVDIVHRRDGTVVFGSAMPGAPLISNLVNPVVAYPYNISLLSVSQPIIAPGMDGSYVEPAAPPPKVALAPAPAAARKPLTPPPAESPVAEEPVAADAPAPAPSPASDAPAPAPDADEETPAADEAEEEPADVVPEKKSAAVKEVVSGGMFVLVIGLGSFLAAH